MDTACRDLEPRKDHVKKSQRITEKNGIIGLPNALVAERSNTDR